VNKYLKTYLTAEKTLAGMHNMHGEKEYKLDTCSQVSVASSYIHQVHSSNCPRCHLVDHVAWKCHVSSPGKATSSHVEKPRLITWKSHVSSRGNNIFHGKLWHFTCKIPHVAMCVHMCRNEVIIEWYCIIPGRHRGSCIPCIK